MSSPDDYLVPIGLVSLAILVPALIYSIVRAIISLVRWVRRPVFDVEYAADRVEGPITEPIEIPVTTIEIPVIPPSAQAKSLGVTARVARPRRMPLRSSPR